MDRQSAFYPPLATVLAMIAVAVAGLFWLREADVVLPAVEDCRLDRSACHAALPAGGRLELALEPRPVPTAAPVRVQAYVEGMQPLGVAVDFQGVAMNMGLHRLTLRPQGAGRFSGETTLPVCVTGRMLWQATVRLDDGRRILGVPFHFESGG